MSNAPQHAQRCAVILGITGQDGAYLARRLLHDGYRVFGTSRSIAADVSGLDYLGIKSQVTVMQLTPASKEELTDFLCQLKPVEIYNLSGQSSVGLSFSQPDRTFESIASAHIRLLEVVRDCGLQCRIFNAGSGECFGAIEAGQKSRAGDPFQPLSPYAVAKVAAAQMTEYFRENHGLFACTGFLYNHESPLRKEQFVTCKIVDAAVRIFQGSSDPLHLGNIEVFRDWGFAGDYADAMVRMLRHPQPVDLVIASGRAVSLAHFVELVFRAVDLDWRDHTETSASLLRKSDIAYSCGDPDPASQYLQWSATLSLEDVVDMLVKARLARA